eukprot:1762557-Pleurochrysis_carterae.AAC.1
MLVASGSTVGWPSFGAVRAAVARPPLLSGASAMRDRARIGMAKSSSWFNARAATSRFAMLEHM